MFRLLIITISDGSLQPLCGTLDSIRDCRVSKDTVSVGLVLAKGVEDLNDTLMEHYQDLDLRVLSEQDAGISDGFNKGLEYANTVQSEYSHFLMLNAGDRFVSKESIMMIKRELSAYRDDRYAAYFGAIYNGSRVQRSYPKNIALVSGINHIGLVQTIGTVSLGRYDTSLKTAMDYDYIIRLMKRGVTFREYDGIYIEAEPNGISSKMTVGIALELRRIQKMHFYDPFGLYDLLACIRIMRLVIRRVARM